jgi:hypothetical protein
VKAETDEPSCTVSHDETDEP